MELCERAGQYVLVTELPGDGASVVDGDVAAAVVSIRGDPGRRRATAAHELGHLVIGDEYSNDLGVHASRADREAVLDAFAAEPPATDASPRRNRPGGWHNPGSTDRACSPLPDFVVIGYPASRPCRSADPGRPVVTGAGLPPLGLSSWRPWGGCRSRIWNLYGYRRVTRMPS